MVRQEVVSEVRGVGWGVIWWCLAAALHVGAVLAIICVPTLRAWWASREDPTQRLAALEGERLRRIVDSLLAVHTRRIREKVAQQQEVVAKLQSARDQRYGRYVESTQQRGYSGPRADPIALLGPAGPPTAFSLAGKDIRGLYDAALVIEETTYGLYRQTRAVELARIQGIALLEASEATKVAVPPHVDINWNVLDEPIYSVTDGRLDGFKNELFKVHAEVGAMVAAALRMLDVALGLVGDEVGATIVFGRGGQFEGAGSGRWGSPVGPTLAPHEFFPGNTDGLFTEDFHPTAGRMLMDDGTVSETGWMYIDTWYIIGPFPNPERQYMDHKFPPESVIDLDATYVGKDNLRLKWQFKQSPGLLVTPPLATNYAVWYAYTEIYSDADRDRFAAFGSDDYSKAWLNGEEVWTSGKTPHRWIPDRGFRTLHFKKGYNPLLVKWENAGGTTGMSVMMYLGPVPTMTSGS
jgi:hypothetical protein